MTVSMPLNNRTVVITRAQEQQSEARQLFETLGARVLDLPALVIGPPDQWGPLDEALADLDNFHWLVFSSSNGVRFVEQRLQKIGLTLACRPKSLKIAAVGRKTATSLQNIEVIPDFVPPNFVADSLIEHFPVSAWGLRMLFPRVQSGGRTILAEAFGKAGGRVVEVAAYESCCPEQMPADTTQALINLEVDAITFTSAKTATNTAKLMLQRFGNDWLQQVREVKLISIGPQTSISCKKHFERVDQQADPHDLQGLANACVLSMN